jgi:transposase
MMHGKKTPLVILQYPGDRGGSMNSEWYWAQVLKPVLLLFLQDAMRNLGGDIYFQQDGAQSHVSKAMVAWLQKHNITQLYHPPNSPDLNPVEMIWHLVKLHIWKCPHPLTSRAELKQVIRKAWEAVTPEEINKCIDMQGRLDAVLAANGGHTKY